MKIKNEKTILSQQEKESFMQRAIELSNFGMENNYGGPFGAVIVKNGKIIGEGFNKVINLNDPTAHAEVTAIRDACKNINNFDLSGTVIFTSCEPCPMCLAAIYWANIDEVYYANTKEDANTIGFRDDFIYSEFDKSLDKRDKNFSQILHSEARKIFDSWVSKTDKVEY
jgi:tRNA(Arg) A34 adenosine deaminase TadA